MRLCRARLTRVRLPLRHGLTRRNDRIAHRESLLVLLEAGRDTWGFGEASPTPGFPTEDLGRCQAVLREALTALVGDELPPPSELVGGSAPGLSDTPCARAALELALFDLHARAAGVPLAGLLARLFRRAVRDRIELNALLVPDAPDALATAARHAHAAGFRAFKWKVSSPSVAHECERAAAVRRALGPGVRLRVDANGGFEEAEATELARCLAPYGLEYLEQPVPGDDLGALARVRRAAPVPIAADEAAAGSEDARAVIEAGAADWIVVKPSLCGGIGVAHEIATAAREAGLGVVVTTALESAVGATGASHLAATLPDPLGACGLATGLLLADDVAAPLPIRDGSLAVPATPGLGVVPDDAALARLRCSEDWEIGA